MNPVIVYLLLVWFCIVPTASGGKLLGFDGAGRRRRAKGSKSQGSKSSSKSKSSGKSKKESKYATARKCKTSYKKQTVELKCETKTGKVKDKVHFQLKTGQQGAEIDVRYKLDNHTDEGFHEKIDQKFEIFFYALVEYLDPTGEDGYDWESTNNDVQRIDLSSWDGYTPIELDEDGVYHVEVETDDGVAKFTFKLSEEDDPDQQLSANRMKVDVLINDFPWIQNDTNVALLSTVEARTKIKSRYHSKKGKSSKSSKSGKKKKSKYPTDVTISFDPDNATLPFGRYSWVTTAEVDNETRSNEVVATSPISDEDDEDEMTQYIAFAFLNSSNASRIYWDPETGVGYPDDEDQDGGNGDDGGAGTTSAAEMMLRLALCPWVVWIGGAVGLVISILG